MTIRDRQILFGKLFPRLIQHAQGLGFGVVIGMGYHSPKARGLAAEIDLFDGAEHVTSTDTHRPLGEWWEAQHELCRWGGRFEAGSLYAIAHGELTPRRRRVA